MILILTNSTDGSSDVLCQLCARKNLPVLRFNVDLYHEYQVTIRAGDFQIVDPKGRSASLTSVTHCYWRKPFFYTPLPEDICAPEERTWVQNHLENLTREIGNQCLAAGKLKLVDPHAERRFGKIMQMSLAQNFLDVPDWQVGINVDSGSGKRIVKTLTPDMIETEARRFVYSTPVDVTRLSKGYPWFVQDLASGNRDVTILYVLGDCYGYQLSLSRDDIPADWRVLIGTDDCQWEPHALPEDISKAIRGYMESANLHFGRLDFIVDESQYWFLEVNSNGQYGWLDQVDSFPIHHRILEAILDPASVIPPYPRPG